MVALTLKVHNQNKNTENSFKMFACFIYRSIDVDRNLIFFEQFPFIFLCFKISLSSLYRSKAENFQRDKKWEMASIKLRQ